MIFKLTTRGCQISPSSYKHLSQHLNKMERCLPNIEPDLVVLRLILRKDIDHYHPPRTRPHPQKTYVSKKAALAFFAGSISFRLNKNRLYAHFKGRTINECLDRGFELIFEKLEKYKELHFPSESEYPDHSSLRKAESEGKT